MSAPPWPRATYRLQFNNAFRFHDGRSIVPYLAELGVSHIYASPILKARPNSAHGYDIVDHNHFNPEIGSPEEFDEFVEALHSHDMGLILDFIPNHMGVGADNPWWMDVLEWGKASPYSEFFDIDWQPIEPTLAGKILLPVLRDHYGAVLERGELELSLDSGQGTFSVTYCGTSFPLNPRSYAGLLQSAAAHSGDGAEDLATLGEAFKACWRGRSNTARRTARRDRIAGLKRNLARLMAASAAAKATLLDVIRDLNGTRGRAGTFDVLHGLLEKQAYRLSFWRVAAHELNYRRFFDINDLAGLRMEQPALFHESHALVARLLSEGSIQGLRLDHVDGLRDPKGYINRLQALADPSWRAAKRRHPATRRDTHVPRPLYLIVEKILAAHESLRSDWPVSGTSGYEFMAAVNGLFIDSRAERFMKRSYMRFIGRPVEFRAVCIDAKRSIMRDPLGSELSVLANRLSRLAKQSRDTRDYSLTGLRQALSDVIANFPVYRTYVTPGQTSAEDRRDLDWAVSKARKTAMASDTSIYDFVRDVLSLQLLQQQPRRHRRRDIIDAALKFQQYTGAVTAKAIEDTAFYRYVCLASLNEVGGDPDRFGVSPAAFHETNRRRLSEHPYSMLATATHDHKRGEDMRARLNVLSEVPGEWARRVHRWGTLNERKRQQVDGEAAPNRNDEYLLYQTIVGAWPYSLKSPGFDTIGAFRDRLIAYMRKAAREAKLQTSWAAPNDEYEGALSRFVTDVLDPKLSRPFVENVFTFVESIASAGALNGLAQTVLKLTSPGVPDVYQGRELWDLSLVDPDNRRPVDYGNLTQHLSAARSVRQPHELLASWQDGRIKQYIVHRILGLRNQRPELFARGHYDVLEVSGQHADRVLAFVRFVDDGEAYIVVVPRLIHALLAPGSGPLPTGWGDTRLELPDTLRSCQWIEILGRQRIETVMPGTLQISELLANIPVAVLTT